jgi:hypothetical protein
MSDTNPTPTDDTPPQAPEEAVRVPVVPAPARVVDTPHPDPTRYGDWEKNGRCIDF